MEENEKTEVILLGANYANALGMVKSVGEAGYNVNLIHHTSILKKKRLTPDMASHYVVKGEYVDQKNDKAMLEALLKRFRKDYKIVVMAADDFSASFLDRYYDELHPYFHVLQWESGKGALTSFTDKEKQKQVATKVGFPVAQCWSVTVPVPGQPVQLPEGILYPCITKPEVSAGNGMSKALIEVCQSEAELTAYFERVSQEASGSILVEEFLTIDEEYTIPGARLEDEVIVPCYIRKIETGKGKVRGLTVMGEVQSTDVYPKLKADIAAFVREIGLQGIFDVEIIRCNGKYYFNEINLRSSAATYAVTGSGVNIPGIYIDYMLGKDWKKNNRQITAGTKFINEKPALQCCLQKDYTVKQYRKMIETADIHLLTGEGDEPSKEAFLQIEKREMTKRKLGPTGMKVVRFQRRITDKIAKFVLRVKNGLLRRARKVWRFAKKKVKGAVNRVRRYVNKNWLVNIREEESDTHFDEICQLLRQSFQNAMMDDNFSFTNATEFLDDLKNIQAEGGKIFTATYCGKLAGTVSVKAGEVNEWYHSGPVLFVKHLAVAQEYARKGIGTMLLKAVEASVQESDPAILVLSTPERNKKAIRFYRKMGYRKVCLLHSGDHYAVRFAKWLGEEPCTHAERKAEYRHTAMCSLMKYGAEEELHSKALRKLWKKYVRRFRARTAPEEWEDMISCCQKYRITPAEYIQFHLAESSRSARKEYASSEATKLYYKNMSAPSESRHLLRNRFLTYEKLKDYYKREMIRVDSLEALKAFAEEHPRFEFLHEKTRTEKRVTRVDMEKKRRSMKKMYKRKGMKKRAYVAVESIEQQKSMSKLHPNYINTVRVVTCSDGERVRIAFALLRIGRGSKWHTNVYCGDLFAMVDPNSGEVLTSAYRKKDGVVYDVHPKTGTVFKGRKLDNWKEVVSTVLRASAEFKDVPVIGWDLACGEQGWVLVDVRLKPSLNEIQMVSGMGIRQKMEKLTDHDFSVISRREK